MATPDVVITANDRKAFTHVVVVDYIEFNTKDMRTAKIEKKYGSWKAIAYTKLNVLNLPYRKIIFMDADVLVIRNMDHLFELKAPAATFSLSQARPYTPKGIYNPYTCKHGELVSNTEIKQGFNTFLCIGTTMLLEPNAVHFAAYKAEIKRCEPFGYTRCVNGPDEQSIVHYYMKAKINWTHIDQQYNMIPWKPHWVVNTPIYVMHYVCDVKPWNRTKGEWPDEDIWWSFYEQKN
jgi:lipopolysaccharide biosynthesis glycosyltransferase